MPNDVVTLSEAAQKLNVAYSCLYTRWRSGRLDYVRGKGGWIYVSLTAAAEALKDHHRRGEIVPEMQ